MFTNKSKKMREAVTRKLRSITLQLRSIDDEDKTGMVYETLVAQRVILEEVLREFTKIES